MFEFVLQCIFAAAAVVVLIGFAAQVAGVVYEVYKKITKD